MTILNKNIFILSGAGISRESGIKTFREKDGLWDDHRIEDVCTIEAFQRNPDLVNNFYNERKKLLNDPKILPNLAHKYIAKLEKYSKKEFLLVTQNIDDLHEKAGSKNLLHMHGTLNKAYCMYCSQIIKLDFNLSTRYKCKNCNNKGKVRVDVVWFGEQPKYLDKIYSFLDKTDVFISVGTSNNVYPAAGLIDYLVQFRRNVELFEFNIEKTNKSSLFKKIYKGLASKTIPKFVEEIINNN
jgi:NAD-dependent deacetylase